MKIIRQYIRSLNEIKEAVVLPWEVIEFLVRMYADDAQPSLSHQAGSFKKNAAPAKMSISGGFHIEWDQIGAMYVDESYTLVINNDSLGDLTDKVRAVLHEIQHYNQHVRWDSEDLSYRDKFIKGKKIPPAIDPTTDDGDPMGLYEMSWQVMIKFWLRRYGYANSPHEVDAKKFAESKLQEALGFIKEHFDLKS